MEVVALSGDSETVCRHSIYNELESDSGKSVLIMESVCFKEKIHAAAAD